MGQGWAAAGKTHKDKSLLYNKQLTYVSVWSTIDSPVSMVSSNVLALKSEANVEVLSMG